MLSKSQQEIGFQLLLAKFVFCQLRLRVECIGVPETKLACN